MFGDALQNGVGVGIGNIPSLTSLPYSQQLRLAVASLFAGGAQGYWFDNSRLDTIWQDSAKTTPGALEAPVGFQTDLSGRGNHRSQSTSANRPTLSALYNQFTKTEFQSGLTGQTYGGPVTSSSMTGYAGSVAFGFDGVTGAYLYKPGTAGQNSTISVIVSMDDGLAPTFGASTASASSNTFALNLGGNAQAPNAYVVKPLGGSLYRVTAVGTAGLSGINFGVVKYSTNNSRTFKTTAWDIRPTDQATGLIPTYQRVDTVSAGGYDTVGFPTYDSENGSNSSMTTAGGGGGTSAFFWCAAVTIGKVGAIQTLYSDAETNTGYRVRINASNQLELSAGNGTAYTTVATVATVNVGKTFVLTAWHDGMNLNVQINQGAIASTPFATAAAGTSSTTIGCDNGAATNYFLGRIMGIVHTINSVPTAGQIAATQAYCNSIGKAY